MKKIHVGIDISKEKCNLCFRSGLEIVREEECSNDVKAIKKAFKVALKVLGASVDEVLVCAEYTGRYIYPLTVACQELDIFLWLDDPTRIKNSMGLTFSQCLTPPSLRASDSMKSSTLNFVDTSRIIPKYS